METGDTYFREVFSAMAEGVVVQQLDGRIVECNPAAESILGLTADQLRGLTSLDPRWRATTEAGEPLSGESHPAMVTLRTGQPVRDFLMRVDRPDGSQAWLKINSEPLYRKAGDLAAVVVTFSDVTELRVLQEQFREGEAEASKARHEAELHRDEARRANAAKSEFLANVSHEIRTPLSAMLGYCDLLVHDSDLAADVEARGEILKTMRRAGEHLAKIVTDVLDLSRIESGHAPVELSEVSLFEVLQQSVDLLQHRAQEQGLELRIELASPLPKVIQSDSTRLQQVVLNLLGNALNSTSSGTVIVRARVQELEQASKPTREHADCPEDAGSSSNGALSVSKLCRELWVDVIDTGEGIEAQAVEKLFEPFVRGESASQGYQSGSGLGLAISRRIARLMDGDVQLVWSQVGTGSCFRLSLPLRVEDLVHGLIFEMPENSTGGYVDSKQMEVCGRILLVEDNDDNRSLMALMLRGAGAEVEETRDGEEGLAKALTARQHQQEFDLIITDARMPRLDGLEMTRQLRNEGIATPVVALTAHAFIDDRERCFEAGCDDYATKPVSLRQLLGLAGKWLRASSQA